MPPPPWELSVIAKPSMLDGLHWKLLGYGLAYSTVLPVRSRCRGEKRGCPSGIAASEPVPKTFADPAGILHALRQNGNSGSFVGAHQRWLLQQFRQVAVDRGIPADDAFQRQPIHLRIVGAAGEVVPAGSLGTHCTCRSDRTDWCRWRRCRVGR